MAVDNVKTASHAFKKSARYKIYRDFLNDDYQRHNLARLKHLASLGLNLDGKRVLEIGAGVGDHTLFYLYRGCDILPTDGRPENVDFIRSRLGIRAEVLDAQLHPEQMAALGRFDILHCYGFLYHIPNPEEFLKHAAPTAETLLLETCVSFGNEAALNPVSEQAAVLSQALHGRGCRPTRPWIFQALKKHFEFVYCPKTQPRHSEFPLDWSKPPANPGALTRAVFIGSHRAIENARLLTELPEKYTCD